MTELRSIWIHLLPCRTCIWGCLAKRGGESELAVQELGQASLLLPRDDIQRIRLFGGGFSCAALVQLCLRELQGCRGQA